SQEDSDAQVRRCRLGRLASAVLHLLVQALLKAYQQHAAVGPARGRQAAPQVGDDFLVVLGLHQLQQTDERSGADRALFAPAGTATKTSSGPPTSGAKIHPFQ